MKRKSNDYHLGQDAIHLIAYRFKILSDPTRLRLIVALKQGEKSVSALASETELGQTTVSRQLQKLTESGILARRKDGLNVFYSIADSKIFGLCEHVCDSLYSDVTRRSQALKGH
jgi:DNA-binding transcriptional ArsR family regulator